MKKTDIINALARRKGDSTYLEVVTPTTGNGYAAIDRTRYRVTERLMYRVRPEFDDGSAIDYRTESEDSSALFAQIAALGRRYDVILVDPFHTYCCSRRDLMLAFSLLGDRGTLVVHDCNPPNRASVHPTFRPGRWCGVTYAAFLDFVGSRPDLDYCTVDADYGCGIIRRRPAAVGRSPFGAISRRRLLGWRLASLSRFARWPYFARHRQELLRLASPREFLAPAHRSHGSEA